MVKSDNLGFVKQAGVVTGAILAIIALGNVLTSFAMQALVVPQIERIVREERIARQMADSVLAVTMYKISEEQVPRILLAMEERSDRERLKLLRLIKEKDKLEGEIEGIKDKEKERDIDIYGR